MTTGPIRYIGDRGMSPFWQWVDEAVGWDDLILGLCVILLICLVYDMFKKEDNEDISNYR